MSLYLTYKIKETKIPNYHLKVVEDNKNFQIRSFNNEKSILQSRDIEVSAKRGIVKITALPLLEKVFCDSFLIRIRVVIINNVLINHFNFFNILRYNVYIFFEYLNTYFLGKLCFIFIDVPSQKCFIHFERHYFISSLLIESP